MELDKKYLKQWEENSKKGFSPHSVKQKGNCIDNAPIESFFGHLKDDIDYKDCRSFEELKALVDEYMYNYNNIRYQWELKKMTPVKYRNHLLAQK